MLNARLSKQLLGLCAISLMCLEGALRVAFPESAFLDRGTDEYWKLRFLEAHGETKDPALIEGGNVEVHPVLGWLPKGALRKGDETTNSRGVRGPREYAYDRPASQPRIVLLGDSLSYGLGVADADVFAHQLEERLPEIEVVNLGVNGFGTDQQYLYWLEEGRRYRPQLVLLAFYLPDFDRNGLSFRELPKPRMTLRDGAPFVASPPASDPWAAAREATGPRVRVLDALRFVGRRTAGDRAPFERRAVLTRAILSALVGSVRETGARMGVILIPHSSFDAYPNASAIAATLRQSASDHRVALLDLGPVIREARQAGDDVYQRNQHWTARGHALAADEIARFVLERGLLP